MGSLTRSRVRGTIPTILAVIIAAPVPMAAQTKAQTEQTQPQGQKAQPPAVQPARVEKFTATTVGVNPGAGENLTIRVSRWSTDADRDRLAALLAEKGDAELQKALAAEPTHGYIWTSESLGYSLRYAYRLPMPDGGERIIVVTDLRLGTWTRGNPWKAAQQQRAPDYPFTMIELRVNRRGLGEGKMSIATKITVDQETKTLALENYKAAPVLLKDVKHDRTS